MAFLPTMSLALVLLAVPVALGATALALAAWLRHESPAGRALAVAVAAVAFAARLATPLGPADLNPRTNPLVTVASLGVAGDGWGPRALELWLVHLPGLPLDERTVFLLGRAWGVLAAVLALALARRAGLGLAAATAGAAVLALHPTLVRFGSTDLPQVPELALGLAAALLALRAGSGTAWGLGAGAAAALAAAQRPEAALTPAAVALVLMGAGAWRPGATSRGQAVALAVAALVAGANLAAVLDAQGVGGADARWFGDPAGRPEHGDFGPTLHGLRHFVVLDPAYTPLVVVAVATLGAVAAPVPVGARLALVVAAAALSAAIGSYSWSPVGGASFGLSRHQVRALPAFAGLVALGVHALGTLPRGRGAVGVGLAAVLAGLGARLPLATAPRTLHAEYAFLRAHLGEVPDGCTIVTFRYPGDAGLAPQPQLSAVLGRDHRWLDLDDPLPASGCVVWYRPANCVTWTHAEAARAARGEPVPDDACAAFEAAHGLTPIATDRLPSGRWVFEEHRVVPVPVGLYRVSVPSAP